MTPDPLDFKEAEVREVAIYISNPGKDHPQLALYKGGAAKLNSRALVKDPQKIKRFIFAGNAIFTLKSLRTGKHYTYKIWRVPSRAPDPHLSPEPNKLFASVLVGDETYVYLGMLFRPNAIYDFWELILTQKSKAKVDSTHFAALSWFLKNLQAGKLPEDLEVRHEGKCGVCGRRLTHPESLDTGIGPVCGGRE